MPVFPSPPPPPTPAAAAAAAALSLELPHSQPHPAPQPQPHSQQGRTRTPATAATAASGAAGAAAAAAAAATQPPSTAASAAAAGTRSPSKRQAGGRGEEPAPAPVFDPAAPRYLTLNAFKELLAHAGLAPDYKGIDTSASGSGSAAAAAAAAFAAAVAATAPAAPSTSTNTPFPSGTLDIEAALGEVSGRKLGKGETRAFPAPCCLSLRDVERCYWGALGIPLPGEPHPPGLTFPQLCEAVARAGVYKWGPACGMAVGWAAELGGAEFEAWLLSKQR